MDSRTIHSAARMVSHSIRRLHALATRRCACITLLTDCRHGEPCAGCGRLADGQQLDWMGVKVKWSTRGPAARERGGAGSWARGSQVQQ